VNPSAETIAVAAILFVVLAAYALWRAAHRVARPRGS
jgi:hypothetical protein